MGQRQKRETERERRKSKPLSMVMIKFDVNTPLCSHLSPGSCPHEPFMFNIYHLYGTLQSLKKNFTFSNINKLDGS